MVVGKSAVGGSVGDLNNEMSSGEMVPIGKPSVVHVEEHLCQQPIIGGILRSVDHTGIVGSDSEGKEISIAVNVKVSIASWGVASFSQCISCLITVTE